MSEGLPTWMLSPAALMMEHSRGKWRLYPHLELINRYLLQLASRKIKRLMVNVPFQHGKTGLCTVSFCSWYLLGWPFARLLMSAHETSYARARGGEIRDVVGEWGQYTGVELKEDTQAKDEWKIERHGGGLVSRGMKGSVQGRPADGFVVEDPYRDWEQAASGAVNEQRWRWYSEVAYPRLSNDAWVLVVSTRWAKNDLCGRILAQAQEAGEEWMVVKMAALAKENDVLGRKPGEPLCPELRSLSWLKTYEKTAPTRFRISYQMEDGVEEGRWFRPRTGDDNWLWPRYRDLGNGAWSCERRVIGGEYEVRRIWKRDDCIILVTLDWAYGKKRWSDFSAMGAFALTPAGEMLVLEVIQHRWGVNDLAPALAGFCAKHRPSLVAVEVGHPTLRDQCRAYADIPEVRWVSYRGLGGGSFSKLQRALPAITLGGNGRILLPERNRHNRDWLEDTVMEWMSFTGEESLDAMDHRTDVLSYAGKLAEEMRGTPSARHAGGPVVLTPGKEAF